MRFIYGAEDAKFKEKCEVLRLEYEEAGMNEADVQAMKDGDRDEFKEIRRYRTHTVSLNRLASHMSSKSTNEVCSPLMKRYQSQLSTGHPEFSQMNGRYGWIEDIDSPDLVQNIRSLPKKDLELITCLAEDGLTRADLSRQLGVSRAAITKRVSRIVRILKKTSPPG